MKTALNAVGLAAILALAIASVALAHEGVTVGPYELSVGWKSEPPLAGQLNGLELFVHPVEAAEHSGEEESGITGLEETLRFQVEYGGESLELTLRPVPDVPGAYTADLLPTREGVYTFHFLGAIEDREVDVAVEVEEVRSTQAIAFPAAAPTEEPAGTSAIVWLALALGLVGTALGAFAWMRRGG